MRKKSPIKLITPYQAGDIFLLPALPSIWSEGHVTGLRARGGFEVDIKWKDGNLTKAVLTSNIGGNCRLRTLLQVAVRGKESKIAEGTNPNSYFEFKNPGKPIISQNVKLKNVAIPVSYVVDFPTVKGENYTILPKC